MYELIASDFPFDFDVDFAVCTSITDIELPLLVLTASALTVKEELALSLLTEELLADILSVNKELIVSSMIFDEERLAKVVTVEEKLSFSSTAVKENPKVDPLRAAKEFNVLNVEKALRVVALALKEEPPVDLLTVLKNFSVDVLGDREKLSVAALTVAEENVIAPIPSTAELSIVVLEFGILFDNVVLLVFNELLGNVRVPDAKFVNRVLENEVTNDSDELSTVVTLAFDERLVVVNVVVNVLNSCTELSSAELGVGYNIDAANKWVSRVSFVNI